MNDKHSALQALAQWEDDLCGLSDAIWDHPETGYHEFFAADAYCRILTEHGFTVTQIWPAFPPPFAAVTVQEDRLSGSWANLTPFRGSARRLKPRRKKR